MNSPVAIVFVYDGAVPSDYMVELLTDLLMKNVVSANSHVTVKVIDSESLADMAVNSVKHEEALLSASDDKIQRTASSIAVENAIIYIGTRFAKELKSTSKVNAFVISTMSAIADHRVAEAHGKIGEPELINALKILKEASTLKTVKDPIVSAKMKEYNITLAILNAIKDIM